MQLVVPPSGPSCARPQPLLFEPPSRAGGTRSRDVGSARMLQCVRHNFGPRSLLGFSPCVRDSAATSDFLEPKRDAIAEEHVIVDGPAMENP